MKYKVVDDLGVEYGVFNTQQEAHTKIKSRRTICIWTGNFIHYRILEIEGETHTG